MPKFKPGGRCGGWGVFWIKAGIPNETVKCPGCRDCKKAKKDLLRAQVKETSKPR